MRMKELMCYARFKVGQICKYETKTDTRNLEEGVCPHYFSSYFLYLSVICCLSCLPMHLLWFITQICCTVTLRIFSQHRNCVVCLPIHAFIKISPMSWKKIAASVLKGPLFCYPEPQMKNILSFTKEARTKMAEKGKSFCLGGMTALIAVNYTSLNMCFCNIQRLPPLH